jgi:hypothetical protein
VLLGRIRCPRSGHRGLITHATANGIPEGEHVFDEIGSRARMIKVRASVQGNAPCHATKPNVRYDVHGGDTRRIRLGIAGL